MLCLKDLSLQEVSGLGGSIHSLREYVFRCFSISEIIGQDIYDIGLCGLWSTTGKQVGNSHRSGSQAHGFKKISPIYCHNPFLFSFYQYCNEINP